MYLAIRGMLAGVMSIFAKVALLCVAMIALTTPCVAFASSVDDAGSNIQLTVYGKYDGEFIPGVNVDLYRVGDIGENGTVLPESTFSSYSVLWDVSTSATGQALANALEAYAMRDDIVPDFSALTDERGAAVLPSSVDQSLSAGWYLVVSRHVADGEAAFEIAPMLVALEADAGSRTAMLKLFKLPVGEFVTIDVFKVWKGEGSEKPDKIEATLLRNGEVYETVDLNDANGWHYAWKHLPAAYEWDVIEKVVPEGYTVSVVKDGNYITLVNKPNEEVPPPPPPELPKTGGMWWPVFVLLVAGVAIFAFGVVRRSRD